MLASISGADLGPIVACVCVFAIPVIAILTTHQRKMAMLFRQDLNRAPLPQRNEFLHLSHELDQLKQRLNEQALLLDTIADQQRQILAGKKPGEDLERRLQV